MFSIAQLLLPISPTQACGVDLSFSPELDDIAKARMYDDPTLDQGEWVVALKEADWNFVGTRCAKLLESKSKDLRLAVWLAEAQAKTRSLRGLGDGYAVLAGLCEHYWDGLYPAAGDGEFEQRIGNLYWLLSRTPQLVRDLPLTEDGSHSLADAEYCLAMLGELERVVDGRLGGDGPGFSPAKDCLLAVIHAIAPSAGHGAVEDGIEGMAEGLSDDGVAFGGQALMQTGGPLRNRAQALAQLRSVADFFRRTEPHSPVAYLADKAASWGDMPLHVWLRAVVKDPAAIAGLDDLLGLPGNS
jgi:type VI secretion system protein ImpA